MRTVRIRDDFNPTVVRTLAMRASYICSNPACRSLTLGPSAGDPEKIIFVGVAAHITAAAPNGPRYDPSLTPEQRSSIENGIFLCPACASIIDKNGGKDFPVKLLRKWKREHDDWARGNLNKSVHSLVAVRVPQLEVCFDDGSDRLEIHKKKAAKKDVKYKTELSDRIIRLDFQLINRGDGPATDIHIFMDFVGPFSINTTEQLRRLWDIYPRNFLDNPDELFSEMTRKRMMPAFQRMAGDIVDMLGFSIFEDYVAPRRNKPKNITSRDIRFDVDGTRVLFHVKKLKQNLAQTFESLYIVFHSWKDVGSFSIPYRINAEELVSDVHGTLEIGVKKIQGARIKAAACSTL